MCCFSDQLNLRMPQGDLETRSQSKQEAACLPRPGPSTAGKQVCELAGSDASAVVLDHRRLLSLKSTLEGENSLSSLPPAEHTVGRRAAAAAGRHRRAAAARALLLAGAADRCAASRCCIVGLRKGCQTERGGRSSKGGGWLCKLIYVLQTVFSIAQQRQCASRLPTITIRASLARLQKRAFVPNASAANCRLRCDCNSDCTPLPELRNRETKPQPPRQSSAAPAPLPRLP